MCEQNLGSELADDMCMVNDTIEFCTVKVDLGGSNIYVLGIYRQHADTITNFNETIVTTLSHNRLRNADCVVIGDLNINLLKDSSKFLGFKSAMFTFHYLPLVFKPTFFSSNAAYEPSCLDHIWTNKASHFDCGIVEYDFTDHSPVFVRLPVHHLAESGSSERVSFFRDRSEGNMSEFREKLCVVDWSETRREDVRDYLEGFTSRLN